MMPEKLRVFILCEGNSAMAANCLPVLAASDKIDVAAVIMVHPRQRSRIRLLRKILRIGFLGALNGIRMRKWFTDSAPNLSDLCTRLAVPFYQGIVQNSEELVEQIKKLSVDIGLSLGNSYIAARVFQTPKFGMINVHSEVLPAYQNAQSIIWPIYCNDPHTGFTIHEIERKIDAGRILYQRQLPIVFKKNLKDTVRINRQIVNALIPDALANVCGNFLAFREHALPQNSGRSYTTPSIFQYIRMCRNNRRFYAEIN